MPDPPSPALAAKAASAAWQALKAVRGLEAIVARLRVELEQARAGERRLEARLAALEACVCVTADRERVPHRGACV